MLLLMAAMTVAAIAADTTTLAPLSPLEHFNAFADEQQTAETAASLDSLLPPPPPQRIKRSSSVGGGGGSRYHSRFSFSGSFGGDGGGQDDEIGMYGVLAGNNLRNKKLFILFFQKPILRTPSPKIAVVYALNNKKEDIVHFFGAKTITTCYLLCN